MGEYTFKGTDKTPVLLIQDYDSASDDRDRIICLSSKMVSIVRSAVWPFFTWRTRVVSSIDGKVFHMSSIEDY